MKPLNRNRNLSATIYAPRGSKQWAVAGPGRRSNAIHRPGPEKKVSRSHTFVVELTSNGPSLGGMTREKARRGWISPETQSAHKNPGRLACEFVWWFLLSFATLLILLSHVSAFCFFCISRRLHVELGLV